MRILNLAIMTAALLASTQSALAQQALQSAQASAAAPTAVNVAAPLAAQPSAAMRQIFQRRSDNIRLHHRPIPLQGLSPAAFTRAEAAAPAPPPPTTLIQTNFPARAAAPVVQVVANEPLADTETSDVTGVVHEPSTAARGNECLFTANWFAAFSTDGCRNFQYMDPAAAFPTPTNEEFCCDQLAYYDRSRDLMVWVLQYIHPTTQGTNRLRIAVARGADIPARAWRFYDFTPQNVGGWTAEWFDFPALATSGGFLYLTTNSFGFGASGSFTRSVALRLPLDSLANYAGFNYQFFATSEVGSLRPAHGAAATMYLVTHRDVGTVRVYEWPEASASLNQRDVSVTPWSRTGFAGPTGTEWLGRADGRITAGWLAGGRLGLAWTAGADATFPFAHVRVARIDPGTWTLSDEPHIWNPTFPFAYPAAAPNASGTLGVGLAYGAAAGFVPSHAVGVRSDGTGSWELVATAEGTHAPAQPVWGDYFTIQPHGATPDHWVTAGYTLEGGSASDDVVPRHVEFRADQPQPTAGSVPR